MDLRVLGPVEVEIDGRVVALGGAKQRGLLAMLALDAGSAVSADRLMEGLWGEHPPPTAPKMVQTYVSQLRKLLADANGDADAEIVTRGRAYELRIAPDALDLLRVERLLTDARDGDALDRSAAAHEALAQWRGGALADVAEEPFAAAEIRRLEELRLAAVELGIDADLDAGRHRELIGELEALVREHPLRERLHGKLMLALYRCGRQAEALDAYRRARTTLVEQIGVEPGAELRLLHDAMLRQDPELDAPVLARRDEAAARTAVGRGGLRAAEADLVDSVADVQAVHERAQQPDPGTAAMCPFKGLATFDVQDAAFFCGRDRLVAEMVARLVGSTLLAVVGPSGSGKSSALRAGLLPALARGVLPGSEDWQQILLRPGEHPRAALRHAVAGVDPRRRVVIAVDQLEEAFTHCRSEAERAEFIDVLVQAAADDLARAVVVVAIRADFYGRCAAYADFSRLLGAGHVLVGPMTDGELREAIEQPARRARLEVEPALTDALVADVDGEPGALPLLSSALLELWQRRDRDVLALADYERIGGVRGAVARLAESAYGQLDASGQRTARAILLRLAGEDAGAGPVRTRVELSELDADRDGEAARVLDVLADRRLVTVSDGTAEVAHEALLREWPRLRAWLDEDEEGRRLHRHLARSARDWDSGGRDPGELYRGARLAAAIDWTPDHADQLNSVERDFLAAGRAAAESDAQRSRRTNTRLRALLAGAAALLALAIVAGAVALHQRSHARHQALAADAQRVGAQALVDDDLARSLLLAREGVRLDDTVQTRGNLLAALLRSPAALAVLPGDGHRLLASALSPDGRQLAVGDNQGAVFFVDPRTRRAIGPPWRSPSAVGGVAFTPDGSRVVVVGGQPPGTVTLLDAHTHRVIHQARLGGSRAFFSTVAFSPDGRTFIAGSSDTARPSMVARIDTRTGAQIGQQSFMRPGFANLASAGGSLVSMAPSSITLRDPSSLRVVRTIPVHGLGAAALSPDGHTVAFGRQDGSVVLVNLRTGAQQPMSGRHDASVQALAFTPDGRTLLSGADDQRIIVWDVARAAEAESLAGHFGRITTLTVSQDGRTLYSAGLDQNLIAWDLLGDRRLGRPFAAGQGNPIWTFHAVSPDGRLLAVSNTDASVNLIDARTLALRRRLRLGGPGPARGEAFTPDERSLLVSTENGFIARVDLATGRVAQRYGGHRGAVFTPNLSRDGRLLVAGGVDGTIRQWDAGSGRPLRRPIRISAPVDDVGLSPDGRWIAAAADDQHFRVWDAHTLRQVMDVRVPQAQYAIWSRFSGDGRILMGGTYAGQVALWHTGTWKPIGRPFLAAAGPIEGTSISPDDRVLATGSTDGTTRLWDLAGLRPLGGPLPGLPNTPVEPTFSPDGAHLFAIYQNGRGYRWDVRPASWAQHACAVAGRQLSREEFAAALPGRTYARVC